MGDGTKCGGHTLRLQYRCQPFLLLEETTNPGPICLKFHPQEGCPPKEKKKSTPVLLPFFVLLTVQNVIELGFRVIMPLLTGANV